MTWRNWAFFWAGLLLGNLVAEWIKDYFNLFGH